MLSVPARGVRRELAFGEVAGSALERALALFQFEVHRRLIVVLTPETLASSNQRSVTVFVCV